jgi:peptide/nickel transport system substrate-binding protein
MLARAACAVACAVLVAAWSAPADGLEPSTLTVGLLSEPATLNPLATTATEARDIAERIYLKLLDEQNDFLGFEPRLAREWSWSKDGLAITFHLREDARWSDGVAVTARDVRFTWELQTDTLVAWPSADLKARVRDVEVVDDHTVVFHFTERYPYQLMDANDGVILPRHVLSEVPRAEIRTHAIGRAPVGCGPYRLARWEAGQRIELEADPGYFGATPVVSRVIFKFVPDMVTLLAQLRAGEIDLLESVPVDHLEEIREQPLLEILAYPSRRMNYVAWNLRRDRFADPGVRRALSTAIDRQEIIRTLWGGYARECKSPIHPILWAYDPTVRVLPFNPAEARAALRRRGWKDRDGDGFLDKDGRRFDVELLTNNNPVRIDAVTLVQAHLKRIGVKVDIRVLEFNTYMERVLGGDFDAAFVEWKTATKVDVTNLWHSASVSPRGYNITGYADEDVDRWIEEARGMLDAGPAKDRWLALQQKIYRDQPVTFLAVPEEVTAIHARFCNVQPSPISLFAKLHEWRIEPECTR